MPAATEEPVLQSSKILDLPHDVLLDIIAHLSGADIVRLFSTSRILQAVTEEESIWRHLCARYGLHDVIHFGGHSFYRVYTGLLHTYGPIMGLWASDAPYTGIILQFRLDRGSETRQGGIVGEMWKFRALEPEEPESPEVPEFPTFIRVLRIGFDAQTALPFATVQRSPLLRSSAQVFCCSGWSADQIGVERSDMGTIAVVLGTRQGVFLHTRVGQFPHPDFPSSNADIWRDGHHRFPRIPPIPQQDLDQTATIAQIPRPRVPIIFTVPTDEVKPAAITVDCPYRCISANWPFLGFTNLIPFAPRFYPLRDERKKGIHPCSELWIPQSLTGLWFGTYGPHGTECVYVHWDDIERSLSAWKITGDENVPRGALTWTFAMGRPYRVPALQREVCVQSFGDLEKCRVYSGTGTISARGYMPYQQVPCFLLLGIVGPDELRIFWMESEDEELSTYVRYKGSGSPE